MVELLGAIELDGRPEQAENPALLTYVLRLQPLWRRAPLQFAWRRRRG